jgi:nucleoside-diphosphate-sugar epimerase
MLCQFDDRAAVRAAQITARSLSTVQFMVQYMHGNQQTLCMSKILVTGGAGFIGSNVCRTLLSQGHTVHAVDNCITGKRSTIAPLEEERNFFFYEMDIAGPLFFETFSRIPVDEIYTLACPTGVPNLSTLAEEMLRTCSYGTFHVLELAKLHRAKVLLTSTAEIYGQPQVTPQDETYTGNVNPLGVRSAYEEGKRFAEATLAMYVRTHGLDARVVRVFNTFGPGMSLSDFRVIPQFLQSVQNRKPLRLYGDGLQTRTHLYVDDLVRGLTIVMEKGIPGEAYNVGGEHQMTVRELAELIIAITNHPEGIVYEPHFIEDHTHRRPAVEKAQTLGWKQEITVEEGLRRMIKALSLVPTISSETPLETVVTV